MSIQEAQAKGYFIQEPSNETIKRLIRRLQAGIQPNLFEVMLIEAKKVLIVEKNYPVAIIISETAFEVFIQKFLIEYYESNNVLELPTGRNNYLKPYKEAIINGNIIESLIKKYLRELLEEDIFSKREYIYWYENAYTKRNDIVHKGIFKINQNEATQAFNSVLNLIKVINRIKLKNCHDAGL